MKQTKVRLPKMKIGNDFDIEIEKAETNSFESDIINDVWVMIKNGKDTGSDALFVPVHFKA